MTALAGDDREREAAIHQRPAELGLRAVGGVEKAGLKVEALVTMCTGGGQGIAAVFERIT